MLGLKCSQILQGPFYIKPKFDTSMQIETQYIAETTD